MIYRMAMDLESNLRLRKFPIVVEYGPRVGDGMNEMPGTIAVSHDTEAGDGFGFAVGVQANPRLVSSRLVGVRVTITAQSNVAGAMYNEHEHECSTIVDGFVTALEDWVKRARAGVVEYGEARFVSPKERTGADFANDAVYLMRFRVARGVAMRDYDGASQRTATIARATTTTTTTRPASLQEDPE